MTKVTGPLFKWFGSKWLASKLYPKPEFDDIYEPYAGSAGYSLRHYEKRVTIWEKNDNLVVLWTWLIKAATSDDIRAIPVGLPEGTDIRSLGLSHGQALLLKTWQRTNNVGDCWTTSPWGHLPGQWTENTRARVADEVHAVKHWTLGLPTTMSSGTYFVDPPYEFNYRYGATDFDHGALAAWLATLEVPHQVIACEAACPKTGAVPTYLPFQFFASRITSRRKKHENHHSRELIYTVLNRGDHAGEARPVLQGLPATGALERQGRLPDRIGDDQGPGVRRREATVDTSVQERQLRLPGLDSG